MLVTHNWCCLKCQTNIWNVTIKMVNVFVLWLYFDVVSSITTTKKVCVYLFYFIWNCFHSYEFMSLINIEFSIWCNANWLLFFRLFWLFVIYIVNGNYFGVDKNYPLCDCDGKHGCSHSLCILKCILVFGQIHLFPHSIEMANGHEIIWCRICIFIFH